MIDENVWIEVLYKNTLAEMKKEYDNYSDALNLTNEFCSNIVNYFHYLEKCGYISKEELQGEKQKIMSEINKVALLPANKRNLFGDCQPQEKTIYINPNISKEERKLFLFHELAHLSLSSNKVIDKPYNINGKYRFSHIYGYQALDEAMAQDIAENLYYKSRNENRPSVYNQQDRILGEYTFPSNYRYYGLYQPITAMFARTLNNCKSIADLSKRAIKGNLLEYIINEYSATGRIEQLDNVFNAIGNIFAGKMKSFGLMPSENLIQYYNESGNSSGREEVKQWTSSEELKELYKLILVVLDRQLCVEKKQ